MTAGIAAALARGVAITEAVQLGAAAGALNVTRHGLGTGEPEAILRLAKRVELRILRPASAVAITPEDLAGKIET